jgi:hypothetical protein
MPGDKKPFFCRRVNGYTEGVKTLKRENVKTSERVKLQEPSPKLQRIFKIQTSTLATAIASTFL